MTLTQLAEWAICLQTPLPMIFWPDSDACRAHSNASRRGKKPMLKKHVHIDIRPKQDFDAWSKERLASWEDDKLLKNIMVDLTDWEDKPNPGTMSDETSVQGAFHGKLGFTICKLATQFDNAKVAQRGPELGEFKMVDERTLQALGWLKGEAADSCVVTNNRTDLVFLGELKTPWVHQLKYIGRLHTGPGSAAIQQHARVALGQLVHYMQKAKLRYGFLSNYMETIYVRIQNDTERGVKVYISPIVHARQQLHTKNKYEYPLPDTKDDEKIFSNLYFYEAHLAFTYWCISNDDGDHVWHDAEEYDVIDHPRHRDRSRRPESNDDQESDEDEGSDDGGSEDDDPDDDARHSNGPNHDPEGPSDDQDDSAPPEPSSRPSAVGVRRSARIATQYTARTAVMSLSSTSEGHVSLEKLVMEHTSIREQTSGGEPSDTSQSQDRPDDVDAIAERLEEHFNLGSDE